MNKKKLKKIGTFLLTIGATVAVTLGVKKIVDGDRYERDESYYDWGFAEGVDMTIKNVADGTVSKEDIVNYNNSQKAELTFKRDEEDYKISKF